MSKREVEIVFEDSEDETEYKQDEVKEYTKTESVNKIDTGVRNYGVMFHTKHKFLLHGFSMYDILLYMHN